MPDTPPLPNPSCHPLSLLLLRRLGEALHEFSSTTTTTPSCCWDSEEDLLDPLPAGTGRGRLHRHCTCDRVRKCCLIAAPKRTSTSTTRSDVVNTLDLLGLVSHLSRCIGFIDWILAFSYIGFWFYSFLR
jgi:hypothetical protein